MKPLNIVSLFFGLLVTFIAGCTTTGGTIGGLLPAPKFLKGSIENNIYTAKDNSFKIAVPHKEGVPGSDEYMYMKVKEVYSPTEDYVSFGPAAVDQTIYRVDVVKRATPGSMQPSFDNVAPEMLTSAEQQVEKDYGTKTVVVQSKKTQINGRAAYYWQLHQVVPPGTLLSGKAVQVDHEIYVIDFNYAVAMIWVQSSMDPLAIKDGLTAQQFAESLTLLLPETPAEHKVNAYGAYRFSNFPVTVMSPASLCDLQGQVVYESKTSVDFVAPDYLWQLTGDYAVQVFPTPKNITNKQSFLDASKKYFAGYVPNDRKKLGVAPKLTEEKEIDVNGLPAMQAIGVDKDKAVLVVTSILSKSNVIVVSVLYPSPTSSDPNSAIPLTCYNKFLNSVNEQN